jgi:3-dehydro-L-gulonate 2-dehydrogenase
MRVLYSQLFQTLERVLLKEGFARGHAARCAELFAQSSRDGVYSHGLNRFPLFIAMVRAGVVDLRAEPALVSASGPIERWDGKIGAGNPAGTGKRNSAVAGFYCVRLRKIGWERVGPGCCGRCDPTFSSVIAERRRTAAVSRRTSSRDSPREYGEGGTR